MSTPLLEVSGLHTYYGAAHVLHDVSICVAPGAVVALFGANGAGKTTLARCISGSLISSAGEVRFHGGAIQNREPDRVARLGINHVPEGREIFPFLSVEQNLEMGVFAARDSSRNAATLAKIYEYFPDLHPKRHQQAALLSGGQQQMLAIGRALMGQPELLILDEPSLGLAPQLVASLFEIIARINRDDGVTILLIEQNIAAALAVADHIYVLETGRMVADRPAAEIADATEVADLLLTRAGG